MNYPFGLNQRSTGHHRNQIVEGESEPSSSTQGGRFSSTTPEKMKKTPRSNSVPHTDEFNARTDSGQLVLTGGGTAAQRQYRLPPLAQPDYSVPPPRTASVMPAPVGAQDILYEMLIEMSQRQTLEFQESREFGLIYDSGSIIRNFATSCRALEQMKMDEFNERCAYVRAEDEVFSTYPSLARALLDEKHEYDALREEEQAEWRSLSDQEQKERKLPQYIIKQPSDRAQEDEFAHHVADPEGVLTSHRRVEATNLVDAAFISCGLGEYVEEIHA